MREIEMANAAFPGDCFGAGARDFHAFADSFVTTKHAKSAETVRVGRERPIRAVSLSRMTERQSSEVEKVLLHISDARLRARKAAETVAKDGADAHIVAALRESERQLGDLHRKLSQGTYYAVPDESIRLAV